MRRVQTGLRRWHRNWTRVRIARLIFTLFRLHDARLLSSFDEMS